MKRLFTIVELLIVIAIIAILSTLLFPSLSKARDKAKGILCFNNLKQLSVMFVGYSDAAGGFLPPFYMPNGADLIYWPANLIMATETGGSIFKCPMQDKSDIDWKFYSYDKVCKNPFNTVYFYPSYGMNRRLGTLHGSSFQTDISFGRFKAPSQTMLLVDNYMNSYIKRGYFVTVEFYQTSGAWGMVDGRHSAAANVLFLDGHSQSLQTGITVKAESYSASCNPYLYNNFINSASSKLWVP